MKIKEVKVDQNLCIGCGSCEAFAPKAFELRDGKSFVKEGWENESEENIKTAQGSCPVSAITIIEE
ncbi:MAG: ferredoxin [Candidatus Paceibacterota bacterium]|jgi:ferredoxin|nr:ferredoxin [Candidatus Paceibacterota bacterium]MDD5621123.1 ferredoxin [Candidatus Paceibacterota bacterium]